MPAELVAIESVNEASPAERGLRLQKAATDAFHALRDHLMAQGVILNHASPAWRLLNDFFTKHGEDRPLCGRSVHRYSDHRWLKRGRIF